MIRPCHKCGGKGRITTSCSMCHDSTWDHECGDDERVDRCNACEGSGVEGLTWANYQREVARNGAYGLASWYGPMGTVTGSAQIDNGPVCVADPRVPGNPELALRWYPHAKHLRRPAPFPLVIATEDGSWHRPMTTLELMLLMDGPAVVDGAPLEKWASDAKMREHIGNGVPVGTGRGIAGQILNTLVAGDMECGIMFGGGGAVWVREREALSAEGTALQ